MSHIFISYARKNKEFVRTIVQALESDGTNVWFDMDDIPKGEDWEKEIVRGIEEADAFLFLLSSYSVASEMCSKEIAHAIRNNKRILPIFIEDVEDKEVYSVTEKFLLKEQKEEINRRNFIFCRKGKDDFNHAIEEVRKTIRTDYDWLKYHSELQVKALRWEPSKDNSRLLRGKDFQEAEQRFASVGHQLDPQPTVLQRQYLVSSRHFEDSVRRMITWISMGVALVMVLLAITAVVQRNYAQEQARIALARQLVAQAQSLNATRNSKQMTAVLLATRSMEILPSSEASQVLLGNLTGRAVYAINRSQEGDVRAIAFRPDSRLLASAAGRNILIIETATGKELFKLQQDDTVYSVAFSPDGHALVSGGRDCPCVPTPVTTETRPLLITCTFSPSYGPMPAPSTYATMPMPMCLPSARSIFSSFHINTVRNIVVNDQA